MTPKLFDPLVIRDLTIANRVWVSPMCQYSSTDGIVGEWHRVHHGAFATGGSGLIFMEATGVVPEGRISIGCPGIWNDEQVAAFKPITAFAHSMGTLMGIQLAHAGRKASTTRPGSDHPFATAEEGGWESVSASAIAYHGMPTPRALTVEEIHVLTKDFAKAAVRAVNAGFDVIEIHAAHGYLLHQFYSPVSNQRSDEYGGSFDNRIRFLLEVTQEVRDAISSSTPLFVRISASDWIEGGWTIDESVALSKDLKALGVDLIDVSSGGNVHNAPITPGPGYQVPFAESIRTNANIMTSAVGMIWEPEFAQEIVSSGKADAVMLAREMLRNPHWPQMAAEKLGVKIPVPIQYERARTLN
ncbi:MAG: NADH:flavin oxidoreductase/NADH oxidase [Actinomycetes bacterium]